MLFLPILSAAVLAQENNVNAGYKTKIAEAGKRFLPDSLLVYNNSGKPIEKHVYEFDQRGNEISANSYIWVDTLNAFTLDKEVIKAYDNADRIINEEIYSRDKKTNLRYGYSKYEYSYYDNGNYKCNRTYRWNSVKSNWYLYRNSEDDRTSGGRVVTVEYIRLDSNGELHNQKRTINRYDSLSLIRSEHSEVWNTTDNKWTNYEYVWDAETESYVRRYFSFTRYDYIFSDFGEPNTRIDCTAYYNDAKPSVPIRRIEYEYDENENMVVQQMFIYEEINNSDSVQYSLKRDGKFVYEYNEDKKINRQEIYAWDYGLDNWRKQSLNVYQFDERGNEVENVSYYGDYLTNEWTRGSKTINDYDVYNNNVLYECFYWQQNSSYTGWVGMDKKIKGYIGDGTCVLNESYVWDNIFNQWAFDVREIISLSSDGLPQISRKYVWQNSRWMLDGYSVYYPFSPENEFELDEVTPFNKENEYAPYYGSVTLGLNIASDDVVSAGSFEICLPQGTVLDKDRTVLSGELQLYCSLDIEEKEDNTWSITISKRDIRTTSDITYKNIVDIVYYTDLDEVWQRGEIVLKNINVNLHSGMYVAKDELKIALTKRNASGIENQLPESKSIYFSNGMLVVDTPDAEIVKVYNVSGAEINSGMKGIGRFEISFSNPPKGMLIIKGSSGWARKLMN
ncbi:hypothetical protein D0T53_06010 [Dysgonomonas sp. 216]|nr:hypothetical protein [Dysgonomonas sp. 216]